MTYSACTYKCIRGSVRRQDHEGYKEGVTFGYMELCHNLERAVCVFVRGSKNGYGLVLHALKTTCHTHVHYDNYSVPSKPI